MNLSLFARNIVLAFFFTAFVFLTGCASTPSESAGGAADDYAFTLRSETTTGKFTYFELSRRGELNFGGGRDAARRMAGLVGTLTPEQRQRVREIFTQYHLLDAESHPFREAKTVSYQLEISGGMLGKSIRAVDDDVPGIKVLHDYLFDVQASVRYHEPMRDLK